MYADVMYILILSIQIQQVLILWYMLHLCSRRNVLMWTLRVPQTDPPTIQSRILSLYVYWRHVYTYSQYTETTSTHFMVYAASLQTQKYANVDTAGATDRPTNYPVADIIFICILTSCIYLFSVYRDNKYSFYGICCIFADAEIC